MPRTERLIIVAGLVALIAIPTLVLLFSRPLEEPRALNTSGEIIPGKAGDQHWHASLMVNVLGRTIDFSETKYMLQSPLVHFEDGDPYVVHKHTTGVTIPYFLSTIKIFMENGCLDFQNFDVSERYCTNATNTLRVLVNGEELQNLDRYDIENDDRMLVYYGPLTGVQLKFLSNQVPPVPVFREKTIEELERELEEAGLLKK